MPATAATPGKPSQDFPARLRGFGPVGVLAMAVICASVLVSPLISGVLVVVWALWSHTPWRELGYTRPKSWPLAITASAAGGVLFKLAMKSLVLPLLGADPINRA